MQPRDRTGITNAINSDTGPLESVDDVSRVSDRTTPFRPNYLILTELPSDRATPSKHLRLLAQTANYDTVRERHHPRSAAREFSMAAYTCEKCGMSVNMTCGQCGQDLVHDTLTTDDGSTVAVSKCPEGHGMIKSPMCCAQDMACSV